MKTQHEDVVIPKKIGELTAGDYLFCLNFATNQLIKYSVKRVEFNDPYSGFLNVSYRGKNGISHILFPKPAMGTHIFGNWTTDPSQKSKNIIIGRAFKEHNIGYRKLYALT